MSTGKRLAKRSIIGTRVCAPGSDGKLYAGVIHAVKTSAGDEESRYSVRFDATAVSKQQRIMFRREFRESELIGPGFRSVSGCHLQPGQRVYLTFNGREVAGEVRSHNQETDEVAVVITPAGHEGCLDVTKRLEEVRLLESRKSARLADQDTDFARLADVGSGAERKRASSHSIDVPSVQGSRKRRPSAPTEDSGEREQGMMDDCTAALVLMSLSCSPHSPVIGSSGVLWPERLSPSPSSDACSWRSSTPSPPLSDSDYWGQNNSDEGILLDHFDDLPRKKKVSERLKPTELIAKCASRTVFQCTWPGCLYKTTSCATIESHVRTLHLGPREAAQDGEMLSDHEEEFYYTEVELGMHTSSPPTLSHRDMARPPHEDPEYQKQLAHAALLRSGAVNGASSSSSISSSASSGSSSSISSGGTGMSAGSASSGFASASSGSLLTMAVPPPHQLPAWSTSMAASPTSPIKHVKLSPRSGSSPYQPVLSVSAPTYKVPGSPTRKVRGDTKKCRKVYGMEHRDQWCTQCKWKKACSRFGD